MKLNSGRLIVLFSALAIPSLSYAEVNKNNPFVKPSERVEAKVDTCDLSIIQELVDSKVSELMPTQEKTEEVVITESMTAKEKIKASGAKLVGQMNGVDVYFDEKQGVFLYDNPLESKDQG